MDLSLGLSRVGREDGQPLILTRSEIEAALAQIDLVAAAEAAFAAFSRGDLQVAAVGELLFEEVDGEAHIKSAAALGAPRFVVKVATGFYRNPDRGLPSSSGLVVLFDARNGQPAAILLDEGAITDERTAAAGAVAAKHLARPDIDRIAVIGAGVQARRQLVQLLAVVECRRLAIWARRNEAALELAEFARRLGYRPSIEASPGAAARDCGLIVTVTPSFEPLLTAHDVAPGAHITAVGSDTPQKGELADDLISSADLLVADSRRQARERGELRRAPPNAEVVELGDIIAGRTKGRVDPRQITLCDLTGVAALDLAAAEAVFSALTPTMGARA